MARTTEPKVNKAVVEQALRHINHHGGAYEGWYVGIEEMGSDRNETGISLPMRFDMRSEDEAKLTMSHLLSLGLFADDEYGANPTILFIYLKK